MPRHRDIIHARYDSMPYRSRWPLCRTILVALLLLIAAAAFLNPPSSDTRTNAGATWSGVPNQSSISNTPTLASVTWTSTPDPARPGAFL